MDLEFFLHAPFWIALGQIVVIDILLGGDNAVVIALACRKLPPAQRTKGIVWGTAAAIALRVVLIVFAMSLLTLPFLKLAGALLLVWIGVKLIAPQEDAHEGIQGSDKLLAAIKTIVVADVVMSLDNVIAIAAAAKNAGQSHELVLVILGLLISVPIIVGGSALVMRLMERFPVVIVLGGMLLGWIAGGMLVSDPVFTHPEQWLWAPKFGTLGADGLADMPPAIYYGAHLAGALLVLALGKWLLARRQAAQPAAG
ncbi:TerC family protein [Comamonas sp. NLF-1-9]|uniref:TerC family protein n=1 Tax=Comamonas sp. NLF-1-9 TaxID=2853163 RepID=UPI001C43718D|nr:TerC family protein [Comamonas sp. NLF-1-9]QXL84047.1 TerC family protein [Comamonas sp. NLF-1-9]